MQSGSDIRLRALVQSAQQMGAEGRLDDAARTWEHVLQLSPAHPQALFRLGQHRYFRKDYAGARELLQRAAEADTANPAIALSLALTCRAIGDGPGEWNALQRALSIDPYFFPALLAKGMHLERSGELRRAAQTYKDALAIAPPDERLSAEFVGPVAHARDIVRQNAAALDAHLQVRLAEARLRHAGTNLERFDETREILLGRKRVYTQQPSLLHIPRLPAIAFYDRERFPWLEQLEAATGDIRREARAVLEAEAADLQPYVSHPDGAPIAQWAELNHSPRWSTYFLWKDGVRYDRQCGRCPATAAASEAVPFIDIPNFGPTIMFSVLAPHTHIPPHSSVSNARLVVHLPLIVPEGCRFRVGNEIRPWREGEAWVFDDTIDHEAWNDSDEYRVILMIDVWNPLLSVAERELIGTLLNGVNEYYASRIDTITGLPQSAG